MTPEQKQAGGDEPETRDRARAEQEEYESVRLSPEVEADLVAEAHAHKAEANELFSEGKYKAALNKYDDAVAACPNYLDYELAVLRSNMAACQLKVQEWQDAVASATAALDGLDKVEREREAAGGSGPGPGPKPQPTGHAGPDDRDDDEAADEEIVSAGASQATSAPAPADKKKRDDDVARIRTKALLRRARARSELGGWSDLDGALADYMTLSAMANLGPQDAAVVQAQLRALPPRVKAAQEREMADMWGKLKDLGNGILKPFGLSTDNFQMVKDEKTGGYSMNFQGGGGQGGS